MQTRSLRWLAAALAVAGLAACGGGDGGGSASGGGASLSGTAAVGAPVAGGAVAVRCASGAALSAVTTSAGAWTVALNGQAFPCLVAVSGGNLPAGQSLHSMALDAAPLNVTPLTTLVLAQAFQADPASLATLPALDTARTALQQGVAQVTAWLQASGYATVPADPLTGTFSPVAGDVHDDLLEQLARSLADAGASLSDLVADAAGGAAGVPLPLTHVFTAAELAAMPQLNKASLAASGDELTLALQAGPNDVGAFVGGGNGNKAVLQLPGLAGTRLKDFKSMAMDVRGPTSVGGTNVYAYVNLTIDLHCDATPLAGNATLADVRARRRILIYDPFVHYVQQAAAPLSDSAFTTVNFDFSTPGWRISAGTPVGSGVAVNPNYAGHETLETFDFAAYPDACIVDGATGDGGMFRDLAADPACNTLGGLAASAPASCGRPYSGVQVILGDSSTAVAVAWKVKNIRFEASTVRNFRFQ